MNGFLKLLLFLVITAGILFGIYSVLPEFSHNIILSFFQNTFDSEAQENIKKTQELYNPKLQADYKTILETGTETHGWVYDKVKKTVTFYGNKAELDLKDIPEGDGRYYDSTVVKAEFTANDKGDVVVEVYLNNSKTPEHEKVRAVVFEQLLNGLNN